MNGFLLSESLDFGVFLTVFGAFLASFGETAVGWLSWLEVTLEAFLTAFGVLFEGVAGGFAEFLSSSVRGLALILVICLSDDFDLVLCDMISFLWSTFLKIPFKTVLSSKKV